MTQQMIFQSSILDVAPESFSTCDLYYADPPYSEHVHTKSVSARTKGRPSVKRDYGFEHLSPELRRHMAKQAAHSKGWALIYSDIESSHLWRRSCAVAGAEYVRSVPWIRWSQPQKSGDRPTCGAEMLSLFWGPGRGRKSWNGPGGLIELTHECDPPDVYALRHKGLRQSKSAPKYSAEKPLDQNLDIISWFSLPGQVVVDGTLGAGTSAVAAFLLDRTFLGFENKPEAFDLASARLEQARAGKFTDRDRERVQRYVVTAREETAQIPDPKGDKTKLRTWERAQRRLADAEMVAQKVLA